MLQILTTRQLADVVVHSYPFMPMMETLFDTIAPQWQLFSSYAKFIGLQKLSHNYIPLCKHGGTQEWS